MSNRRKPRNQRRQKQQRTPVARPPRHPLAGMEPWVRAMQDADEAERRGDVGAALTAMRRRAIGPDGKPFWRESRMMRLVQLELLAPFVPGWARSRWITEQALQCLSDAGPGSLPRRALHIAEGLRSESRTGRDRIDAQTATLDRDWVYRQVHLFELGGLEAFLRQGASPHLVAGADRIAEWALAPMGGYLFAGSDRDTSLWIDLGARSALTTPNIGTAAALVPGDGVIGRLVPIEGGEMFDDIPLVVPEPLARAVAADPSRWLDLLRESGHVRDGVVLTDVRRGAGLLSDVSAAQTTVVLSYLAARVGTPMDGAALARSTLDLARETLDDEDRPECEHEDVPEECDECADDGWDGWAQLHAALLFPEVVAALPGVITPEDEPLLREIRWAVAEPARSWVGWLLDQLAEAA